jgi:hypothetical protein
LNDDLLRLGGPRVVAEKNLAVNAVVRAFLLLDGARADEAQRPPLKLELVFLRERGGFVWCGRLADDADEGSSGERGPLACRVRRLAGHSAA